MRFATRRPAANKPIYAPTDIRENKAARVAFLQAEVARLQAEGFEARLSGTGTLQSVRYAMPKVRQTKRQLRGLCQCCGRLQAVQRGRLVQHGYERPGYGFQTASCRGTYELALADSCDLARRLIVALQADLPTAKTPNARYGMQQTIAFLREIVANWDANKYVGTTREYEVEA